MTKILMYLLIIILSLVQCTYKKDFQNFDDFLNQVKGEQTLAAKTKIINAFLEFTRKKTGFPYREGSRVYFIYYNTSLTELDTVKVGGPYHDYFVKPPNNVCNRIPSTDFFYFEYTFEDDARIDYAFQINNSEIKVQDPLNPPSPDYFISELVMPGYVYPPEIKYYDNYEHGSISEALVFESNIMGQLYIYKIYLPPGYDGDYVGGYPTMYFLDGDRTLSIYHIVNIAEYLIHHNLIRKIIMVLLNPNDRPGEQFLNPRYADFMAKEFVPLIDSTYNTVKSPDARGISGFSGGALASIYISLLYPDVFRLSSSQSPAFWVQDGKILEMIKSGALSRDVKVYMDWGTYEPDWALKYIREGRDLILKNGNELLANEYHEAHHFGQWRAHIDDCLKFFFPPETEMSKN